MTEVCVMDVHGGVNYFVDPYPSMGVDVAKFECYTEEVAMLNSSPSSEASRTLILLAE